MPPRKTKAEKAAEAEAQVRKYDLPRAEVEKGKDDVVVQMRITDEVRKLMRLGMEHWLKALKGMKNRESGMGLDTSATERCIALLEGTDVDPGIMGALAPQAELDFGDLGDDEGDDAG